MITPIDSLPDGSNIDVDICIVGAGPAGITIADALRSSGLRVLLLESGGFEPDAATQDLYAGRQRDRFPPMGLVQSRLRYFGGTSNHWGGGCGRLDPIDFETRPWMPLSGWPIGYSDVAPYYDRAEQLLGIAPGLTDPEAPLGKGATGSQPLLDIAGSQLEHRVLVLNPVRFGQSFRQELSSDSHTQVLLGANLTHLVFSEDGTRILGVSARSLGGRVIAARAKQVVLACGGIENARLLLLNGIGRRLDYVGRCFQWHARVYSGLILLDRAHPAEGDPYDWFDFAGLKRRFNLGLSRAAQEFEELPNNGLLLDTQTTMVGRSLDALGQRLRGERESDGVLDDIRAVLGDPGGASKHHRGHGALAIVTRLDQVPNPDSRVELDGERDALGSPRVRLSWRHYDYERAWVREMNILAAREIGSAGIGRVQVLDDNLDESVFLDRVFAKGGGGHQIGTTRMSASALDGVVDANSRVHGLENLYCAGSSVFSTGGWINPTLTIVALSLRLAEHLRGLHEAARP